jgi:hypothetical protein
MTGLRVGREESGRRRLSSLGWTTALHRSGKPKRTSHEREREKVCEDAHTGVEHRIDALRITLVGRNNG